MGLAASQARFLGITARKNACELRSMEIAQERLSVSNQLSQASQNYMTSLNATKLIWNPDRTDDFVYQLDYASMSRPSRYNDFQLQLLTNIKGQTVLDSSFYGALSQKNFQRTDGTTQVFSECTNGGIARTQSNFELFIKTLNEQGIINDAYLTGMLAALNTGSSATYIDENGFGKNLANLSEIYSTDLNGLCEYVDDLTIFDAERDETYLDKLFNAYGTNPLAPTPYDMAAQVLEYLNFENFLESVTTTDNGCVTYQNSSRISVVHNAATAQDAFNYISDYLNGVSGEPDWSSVQAFNFSDVLGTNDLALVGYADEHEGPHWGNVEGFEEKFLKQIDEFVDNLENIAKYFFEYNGEEDAEALEKTRRVIESLYKESNGNLRMIDANYYHPNNTNEYSGGAPDYMNYCIPVLQEQASPSEGYTHRNVYVLSLANLAQAFFTEYENQRSAGASGYSVATSTGFVGDCNLITMDQFYVYDYVDAGTTNPTGEITQILNYYMQMFNQIAVKGFVYNPAVDDADKMQNMIKNGSLVVSTIADDNYFYQYDYLAYGLGDGYFVEVADEDEITLAEAEYKVKQAQLNAKEEELAVDMQNVEAELAALTTEYDTVKNLINKAVQKDFTTCGG